MRNPASAGLLTAVLAITFIGAAQSARKRAIADLAFLSGRWVSETPSDIEEESWTPVKGESMTGTFRILRNGRPVFYEFWVVELAGTRPVMKMKHFSADLLGWEEKNVCTRMPLVSVDENDAIFAEDDGSVSLHYHLTGSRLTCTVHHVKDGRASDEIFTLTRSS